MRPLMKKVAGIILLLTSVLFLSGCIEVVYEIGVDENDVEHLTMRMGMPAMLAPYMGEIITKVQNEGFFVKTDTQGDKVWIIGAKEYTKDAWDLPALPSSVTITSVTRDLFQVDDYVIFKKYILDVEYQYQSNSTNGTSGSSAYPDSMFTVPVKFVVTLPGTVLETNAHERQGEAAVWNYVIAQNGTIAMKLVTYKLKWGLLSALLLSLAVFIGAIVFLVSRSSRSRAAPGPIASRSRTAPVRRESIATPTTRTETAVVVPPSPTPQPAPPLGAAPTQPASSSPGSTYYVVTLSLPPDPASAAKIIQTLAKSKNKTTAQIIDELKAGSLTIRFTDKGLLEKNLAILQNGGFSPKVTSIKK
jgi:hypothetical protein